jgi:hypothetical protein
MEEDMTSTGRRAIGVAILLTSSACGVFTQPVDPYGTRWGPPFQDTVKQEHANGSKYTFLGAGLEQRFENLLQNCQVLRLDRSSRSAIPLILQQTLSGDLEQPVLLQKRESASNLFRFVFDNPTLKGFPSQAEGDYLSPDLISLVNTPAPAAGSRSITHQHSCTSIVHAAMSAGFKLPAAALSAALNNDFQDHSEFVLVEGRFFSPLQHLLSYDDPTVRRRTLWRLWQWYRDKGGARPNTHGCYVAGFSGVAIYEVRRAAKKAGGAVEASASQGIPVISADGSLSFKFEQQLSTAVTDYQTMIYAVPPRTRDSAETSLAHAAEVPSQPVQGQDVNCESRQSDSVGQIQFASLPTPREIASELEAIRPRATSNQLEYDPTSGQPLAVEYAISGIPPALCNANEWIAGDRATLTNLAPHSTTASTDTLCTLIANYTPSEDLIRDKKSDRLMGGFTLRSNPLVPNVLTLTLEFPVQLVIRGSVRLLAAGWERTASGSTGASALPYQWTANILVQEGANIINWKSPPLPEFFDYQIACGDALPAKGKVKLVGVSEPSSIIKVDISEVMSEAAARAKTSAVDCTLDVDLMLPLRNRPDLVPGAVRFNLTVDPLDQPARTASGVATTGPGAAAPQ